MCLTRPRYQVSVYRTIGPLVFFLMTFPIGNSLPSSVVSSKTNEMYD